MERKYHLIFAGCGALGSQIAVEVAQYGRCVSLLDDDTVGEENIEASAYGAGQVGMTKTDALHELIYDASETLSDPHNDTLSGRISENFGVSYPAIIVDTFDNPRSRRFIIEDDPQVHVLHVGVGEGGIGRVEWDRDYKLPEIDYERGENPVCTHHLSLELIRLTADFATRVILAFMREGKKYSALVLTPEDGIASIVQI